MSQEREQSAECVAQIKVEFISRMIGGLGKYQRAIRESIPLDFEVPVRAPKGILAPGDRHYGEARKRFTHDTCSFSSMLTLLFLYQYELYLSRDFRLFFETYKDHLGIERMEQIEEAFPEIDQTTICDILDFVSKSTIANRLSDLSKIGLIAQKARKRPFRKFTRISDKGLDAVEKATDECLRQFAPLFIGVPSWSPDFPAAHAPSVPSLNIDGEAEDELE